MLNEQRVSTCLPYALDKSKDKEFNERKHLVNQHIDINCSFYLRTGEDNEAIGEPPLFRSTVYLNAH